MKKIISTLMIACLLFSFAPTNLYALSDVEQGEEMISEHNIFENIDSVNVDYVDYSLDSYPESPHNYANDANIDYTYSCPGAEKLEIKFSSLCKTESNYDFVSIYDSNDTLIGKYSGTQLSGQTVTINDSYFRINLTTDRSKTFYGFSIDSINATKSGLTYFVPSVSKSQSNHNYANNLNEDYYYSCPGADSIDIKFARETFTEKNWDFITIFDSKNNQLGKYSGAQLADKTIHIDDSSARINFSSDRSKSFYGFKIDRITGSFNSTRILLPTQDYSFTIPKEMYPESSHNYENNLNNSYSFRYPNAKSLTLKFSSKTETEAKYDILYLYDGNNNLVGQYSGTELSGKTIEIPTGSFKIKFTSDYAKTYYGFSFDEIIATMHSNPGIMQDEHYLVDSNLIYPQTSHDYANNADETFYYRDCYASSLDIKFSSKSFTEKNYDVISIYDENDVFIGEYSGDQLAGKTIHIEGSSVKIRFTSDGSKVFYGYSVDYITSNYVSQREGSNIYAYPESNHKYEQFADNNYEYSFPNSNVKKLCVYFNKNTYTEQNYDFIYIYDSYDNLIGKYTGSELASRSIDIPGNSFRIRLTSDRASAHYGFKIDKIIAVCDEEIFDEENCTHDFVLTNMVRPSDSTPEKRIFTCKKCLTYAENINADIYGFTYTLSDKEFVYDGSTHKPRVTIENSSNTLKEGTHYTLTYQNSSAKPGYYKIRVDFKGGYSGTNYLYYRILPYNKPDTESYRQSLRDLGFPESYVSSLAALHFKYPEWEFKPYKTNLDWQTAVNGERTPHSKQRIMKGENVNDDFYCYCSACTDKNGNKILSDSSYAASEKAVKYYMDPRNWLDEKHIFQFETTNGGEGQTKQGVEAILKGTWMYDSLMYYKSTEGKDVLHSQTMKYSDVIMTAASVSGLAPYYIASKIKQEVGSSTASYAGGSNGTTAPFQGIYNYFNIGAYNGARDGLAWAAGFLKVNDGGTAKFYKGYSNGAPTNYSKTLNSSQRMVYIGTYGDCFKVRLYTEEGPNKYGTGEVGYVYKSDIRKKYIDPNMGGEDQYYRPWINPYRAIVHGSRYVYNNFGVYQYTGYLQKFNVTPNQTYSHEYMVNISSAQAEGTKIYKAYSDTGLLNQKHIFYIPVFNNM